MSEGAVPITEEIEELKKKLALLGKPWSTTLIFKQNVRTWCPHFDKVAELFCWWPQADQMFLLLQLITFIDRFNSSKYDYVQTELCYASNCKLI